MICVARHAQPEGAGGPRRFLGQSDPPLSAAGLEQAEVLAERLAPLGLEAIYCSDLARSLSTAQVVGERTGVPVSVDPRLREIDIGLWDGLTLEQARQLHPHEYAEREADVFGYPFPGGESFRDLDRRVAAALEDILAKGAGTVLIVAHLGVNRVLVRRLKALPLEELFSLKQGYCDVECVRPSAAAAP